MFEGMDFENTPLVVESLSKEMQNPPRVLQEKKPGGGEAAQNSSWRAHTLSPPYDHCSQVLTSLLHHYRLQPQGGHDQAYRTQSHK